MTSPADGTGTLAWGALELHAASRRAGLEVDLGTANRLARDRFDAGWIGWLVDRADEMGADDSLALVASWLRSGRWDDQVLFRLATTTGLWGAISPGGRFNRCRQSRKAGLRPGLLCAILEGARTTPSITDPVAFVGSILARGTWVRFADEVNARELRRPLADSAVLSIVRDVIRRQRDKLTEGVGR